MKKPPCLKTVRQGGFSLIGLYRPMYKRRLGMQLFFVWTKKSCKRNATREGKISISLAQVANKFAPRFGYKRAPGTFA